VQIYKQIVVLTIAKSTILAAASKDSINRYILGGYTKEVN